MTVIDQDENRYYTVRIKVQLRTEVVLYLTNIERFNPNATKLTFVITPERAKIPLDRRRNYENLREKRPTSPQCQLIYHGTGDLPHVAYLRSHDISLTLNCYHSIEPDFFSFRCVHCISSTCQTLYSIEPGYVPAKICDRETGQ